MSSVHLGLGTSKDPSFKTINSETGGGSKFKIIIVFI